MSFEKKEQWRIGKRAGQDRWQIKQAPGWKVAHQTTTLEEAAGWLARLDVDLATVSVLTAWPWKTLAEHMAESNREFMKNDMNTTTDEKEEIRYAPHRLCRPSPLNPRQDFSPDILAPLEKSVREHGIIQPLIVRPAEPTEDFPDAIYEIVTGECRWRVSPAAGLEVLPLIVRQVDDKAMIELMLTENMIRNDLSPMEESDAFAHALETGAYGDGSKTARVKLLAKALGISEMHVWNRLALQKLPSDGRDALGKGEISLDVAERVAKCPEPIRELVMEVTLNPDKHGAREAWQDEETGPLVDDEVEQMISDRFVKPLYNVPFDLADADLLTVETGEEGQRLRGGACADCPWNTKLELPKQEERCMNPPCLEQKLTIFAAAARVRAVDAGEKLMDPEDVAHVLWESGELRAGGEWVFEDKQPSWGEIAPTWHEKQEEVPTWGEMVKEMKVPVTVAITTRGVVRRLLPLNLVLEAARVNGNEKYLDLSVGRAESLDSKERAEREKKQRDEQKQRGAVSMAVMAETVKTLEGWEHSTPPLDELMRVMAKAALWLAGNDGLSYVFRRRVGRVESEEPEVAVERMIDVCEDGLPLLALTMEILLSRKVKFAGWRDAWMAEIVEILGIDAEEIERRVIAGEPPTPPPSPAPEPVAETAPEAPKAKVLHQWTDMRWTNEQWNEAMKLRRKGALATVAQIQRHFHFGYVVASAFHDALEEAAAQPFRWTHDEWDEAAALYAAGSLKSVAALREHFDLSFDAAEQFYDALVDAKFAAENPAPEPAAKPKKAGKKQTKGPKP